MVTGARARARMAIPRVVGIAAMCASAFAPLPGWAGDINRRGAAQSEDPHKKAARALADEGQALYDRGDYKGAVDRFSQAEAIAPVPTVEVALAKALLKLGRLVDAAAVYERAGGAEVSAESPPALIDAVGQAKKELRELLKRVPTIELSLGPGASSPSIDGKPVPPSMLGAPLRLDPGTYVIAATGAPSQKLTLVEGDRRTITLAPPPAPAPTDVRFISGIAGIGLGAVTLGIGIASTARMMSLNRDIEPYRDLSPYTFEPDICVFAEQTRSDPMLRVDSANIVRLCDQAAVFETLQIVMYPLHAAVVGGGIYLLATSVAGTNKKRETALSNVDVVPRVGPGAASIDLTVRF
jgi:hypothetical protein